MPLTTKGNEIMAAMKAQYGDKKGEEVFYASRNAGTISGVDAAPSRWPSQWTDVQVKEMYQGGESSLPKGINWSDVQAEYRKRTREMNRMDALNGSELKELNELENLSSLNGAQLKRHQELLRKANGTSMKYGYRAGAPLGPGREDAEETLLDRLDSMAHQVHSLGKAAAAMDDKHPVTIRYQGKKFSFTGKTGTRISNGKEAGEYEEVKDGRRTGYRVWRELKSGQVYPD